MQYVQYFWTYCIDYVVFPAMTSIMDIRERVSVDVLDHLQLAGQASLGRQQLMNLLQAAINKLNVSQARNEAEKFVKDKSSLELWSREFFLQIVENIQTI